MNILALYSGSLENIFATLPSLVALSKSGHQVYLLVDGMNASFEVKDILEGSKYIKDFRVFNASKERNGDSVIAWIVSHKIDVCVELFPSGPGFKWLFPYLSCGNIVRSPAIPEDPKHIVDINIENLKGLVREVDSRLYDLPRYHFDHVEDMMSGFKEKVIVAICPSYKKNTRSLKKNWGVENYSRLINLLPDDTQPILIDDSEGIGVCNHIEHLAPRALNLAGRFSLKEMFAVIEKVDIVISNDCYFAHIAAGLDKHLMVFFDEKSLERSRPIGPRTVILKANSPEHTCVANSETEGCFCIASIPPESVYNAVVKHVLPDLQKNRAPHPVGA